MRRLLVLVWLGISLFCSSQPAQKVSSGKLVHLDSFASKYVPARNVDIWLPEGYDGKKKFDVLYMHDGQMLFDSLTTWNHQTWDVDGVAGPLMNKKLLRDFIVVGIWNIPSLRHSEYFPERAFERMTAREKDTVMAQLRRLNLPADFKPASDNYLKFLVSELKPAIERRFRVFTEPAHNFIAGSSMGGLISLYAICEYPQVFGGAACLSTHWPGSFTPDNNPIPIALFGYMKEHLPDPRNHKLYFDYGDQTLDAMYPPLQQRADSVVKARGYSNTRWQTRFFPGKDHSEKAWNERLAIPLGFLLGR